MSAEHLLTAESVREPTAFVEICSLLRVALTENRALVREVAQRTAPGELPLATRVARRLLLENTDVSDGTSWSLGDLNNSSFWTTL